jgi:hypothetical protein
MGGENGLEWAGDEANKIIGIEEEYADVLYAIESAIVSYDDKNKREDVDVVHSLKNLIKDPWGEYDKGSIEWKVQKNLKERGIEASQDLSKVKKCLRLVLYGVKNRHNLGPRGYLDFIRDCFYLPESCIDMDLDRILYGIDTPTQDKLMYSYEKSMKKKQDSIQISLNTRIAVVLNKYPSQWVDGICEALGIPVKNVKREKVLATADMLSDVAKLRGIIDELPKDSLKALRFVYENGGWVRYGQLTKRFGGEEEKDSWWWNEKPPASPIGQLRLHGLLAVGKNPMKGRMYKVVVIPKEVREGLKELEYDKTF